MHSRPPLTTPNHPTPPLLSVAQVAGGSWQEDLSWQRYLHQGWDREAVVGAMQHVVGQIHAFHREQQWKLQGPVWDSGGLHADPGTVWDTRGGDLDPSSQQQFKGPPPTVLVRPDAPYEQNAHRVRVLVHASVLQPLLEALEEALSAPELLPTKTPPPGSSDAKLRAKLQVCLAGGLFF